MFNVDEFDKDTVETFGYEECIHKCNYNHSFNGFEQLQDLLNKDGLDKLTYHWVRVFDEQKEERGVTTKKVVRKTCGSDDLLIVEQLNPNDDNTIRKYFTDAYLSDGGTCFCCGCGDIQEFEVVGDGHVSS